ncbi:MAG: DUF481 domain-containing protein [Elusimicrobiota bacterium]|nr:DUF481 domain-containing protein [Elusimicrobiota bacterium]
MRKLPLLLVLFCAPPASAQEAAPAKKWKGSAEFSFISANGNTKSQTLASKNAFSYLFTAVDTLEMEGGGLGSRNGPVVTAEQYYASEKISHKLDDRNYLFEKYRWDRNRFAGVAHRHDLSAGAGREFWKTPKDLLIGEAAPGYLNEERFNDKRKTYAASRFYAKYTRELAAGSRFSQDADYVQSLADKRDNRLATETALSAALTTSLAIKNTFTWRHDSRPPVGKVKDDTIFAVALVATF